MRQCEAALLAEGIGFRWQSGVVRGVMLLDVPTSESERAAGVLSDQLGEDLKEDAGRLVAPSQQTPLLLRSAFAFGLGMAALTLAFFWVAGGSVAGSDWHGCGALSVSRLGEGQGWRVITAATLHADARHAVGNAAFFLVLGWGAAERLGAGAALWVWLATAVCGYGATVLFTDVQLTVGASGGLYGLLGAAAGHGLRHGRHAVAGRRRYGRILGAAILFVAYTAFGPRANIAAHLGGFAAGLVGGVLAPRKPVPGPLQAVFAAVVIAVLSGAWWAALTQGNRI